MTEQPLAGGRHWLAAVLVAAAMLPVAGYAARAATALAMVSAERSAALLGSRDGAQRASLAALPEEWVRTALAANPLRQRIVNVAMVRAVDRGARLGPWIAQVTRLGWRDTTALQNKLYVAALAQQLPTVLSTSDALLRRQELTDQIVPVLSMMETDPGLRAMLVRRIAAGAPWRGAYLSMTGHLQKRDQLLARYRTVLDLERSGVRLTRGEVAQNIRQLDAGGMPALAFALWQRLQPGVTRPLDDTGFVRAGANLASDDEPLPFQWQMLTGEGFDAGASVDNGQATLDIDWNGRGVPVFARQRTSALPGAYALDIDVAAHEVPDLKALTFTLTCGDGTTALRQVPRVPTRFVTERPVPCAYPVLEIGGDVQSAATPHQLSIRSVTLRRLGSAG